MAKGVGALLAGVLLFGGVLTAVVVGGATPAAAQQSVTLYVTQSGSGSACSQGAPCGSVSAAISTATGGTYDGDDVTIDVAGGTYSENDTVDASLLDSLTITGAGASSTLLNGGLNGTVLTINGGTVDISGVTIENGENANEGGGLQSCVATSGCVTTISDSTFSNDSSNDGGAIDNADEAGNGTLTVTSSTFTNDSGTAEGGAINNGGNEGNGTLIVSDSIFTGDSSAGGGRGGAIDNADNVGNGTVTVTDSKFTDDSADWGGGAIENGADQGQGSVTVTGSTFTNDTARLDNPESVGGALDNGKGTMTVADSTFAGNQATNGGAVGNGDNAYEGGTATLAVTDSTFWYNTATGDGGAIDNADDGGDGSATVMSSTFSSDGASGNGQALDNADNGGTGTLDLGATILAATPAGNECSGITDDGYNIADEPTCGLTAGTSINNSNNVDSLGSLADNGGPTQTILPVAPNQALGAIPNDTSLDGIPVCPTADQRGVSPTGSSCDVGAVQGSTPTVANIPPSGIFGGSFTPIVAGSGLGSTSVTSSTPSVCRTVLSAVDFVGVGTCTLTAHMAAGLYNGAENGSGQSFDIGPDSTTTSLSTNVFGQLYGHEGATTFTVTVQTGNGELVPTNDSATVDVGSASCMVTLLVSGGGGSGGCSIGNSALGIGSYTASVTYGGDADLTGSGPATTPFTVLSTTTVSAVSPNTGLTTVANPVTITGAGFTGATAVDVDGVPATGVTVVNDSTITATLPTAVSAGAQDVTVTAPGGTSAVTPADTFTYTVEASPTVIPCDTACSTTVSTPLDNTTVAVSGPVTAGAQVSVVTNTASLNCGAGYTYASPLTTLSGSGFNHGADLTVKLSEGGVPSVVGAKICYQSTGSPITLATCGTPKMAPCVKSLTDSNGKAVAKVLVPAGDPRMKLVTPEATLTSFTPLKGNPGSPVLITGTNLEQITTVVIGGATAPILQQTATTLNVDVPQTAVKGLITLDADSGDVTSTAKFKVK